MSHFSFDRKRAAVSVFKLCKRLKTEHGYKEVSPVEFAQAAAGSGSETQVYTWLKEDLSIEAEEHHEESRGSAPLLSDDEKSLLVGFACFKRSSLKPVSTKTLLQFCTSHLSATPSQPTISRIMREFGFSSQRTLNRNSRMVSREVVEDALDAIVELRSYGFSPEQLLFMDETGLWSNVTQQKTYHFSNW